MHEVAQAVAPSARVVYVDNDPLVLAHARALLTSSPEGRTAYIHADLRDPAAILNDPVTRDVLDFTQPVALMLVAILHMIPDEEKPAEILATLLGALPSGSYILSPRTSRAEHNAGAAAAERPSRRRICRLSGATPTCSRGWRLTASTWCRQAWCSPRSGGTTSQARAPRRPR